MTALFEPAQEGRQGCRRHWCIGCREEMIHRDHRKFFESSSGFGQIINRDYGRGSFGFADVDLVLERRGQGFDGLPLLVVFEHKELSAKIGHSQQAILRRLAMVVHHAVVSRKLDPKSGVFTVRGAIEAMSEGRRETYLAGEQVIERMLPSVSELARESWTVTSQDELFSWIDGVLGLQPQGRRRPNGC